MNGWLIQRNQNHVTEVFLGTRQDADKIKELRCFEDYSSQHAKKPSLTVERYLELNTWNTIPTYVYGTIEDTRKQK